MSFIYRIIFGIFLNALALFVMIRVVDGITYTGGIKFFVIGGLVIGVLNLFVKPFVKLASLPAMFFTGGLVLFLVNAVILWLLVYVLKVADFRDTSIVFANFSSYVIGGLVFGFVNWTENLLVK